MTTTKPQYHRPNITPEGTTPTQRPHHNRDTKAQTFTSLGDADGGHRRDQPLTTTDKHHSTHPELQEDHRSEKPKAHIEYIQNTGNWSSSKRKRRRDLREEREKIQFSRSDPATARDGGRRVRVLSRERFRNCKKKLEACKKKTEEAYSDESAGDDDIERLQKELDEDMELESKINDELR
ncbi:unnamed protein product [Brassica napus]|uniref:(rape) hypothetical protein n=1 Tax=Brassica napus TaxID=3708 RepID=A0A816TRN0_BRANA|nr:unnamed protein product [Brassica napus]